MLGSPALIRGLQWWPVRSGDGAEGWVAAFDPGDPGTTWLEATGAPC